MHVRTVLGPHTDLASQSHVVVILAARASLTGNVSMRMIPDALDADMHPAPV